MRRLRIALGQFSVRETGEENLAVVRRFINLADEAGADLLVLPEGIIAEKAGDQSWPCRHAETPDGPFVTGLLEASMKSSVSLVCTVHLKHPGDERPENDLLVIRRGKIELVYPKIHLYDAFAGRESDFVRPGKAPSALIGIGPFRVGFMTCYDIRFPELARRLALDGASLLVVPAYWYKGPLKESHWDLCIRSRALENTCWVAAVSACGPDAAGLSKIADPFGTVTAQAGTGEELLVADIDADRVDEARRALPVLANRRFAKPEMSD